MTNNVDEKTEDPLKQYHEWVRKANLMKIKAAEEVGRFVPCDMLEPPFPGVQVLVRTEQGGVYISHLRRNFETESPYNLCPHSAKHCIWTGVAGSVKVVAWYPIPLPLGENRPEEDE